ncbi:MAG: hypothetical protein AVDCRST_MAG56-5776 [uncultured Cytophagales bacterium]|uniref:Uncharacterized protein n=1 Tax=uncultured Cytophagales bacterium TaxID=158755 RepID=A0A6J4KJG3_9SPHI|nr:MAG: hypothetical protein AVDCRST_MAG56-5776 [uncultured Cytophagales bacterium]
MEVTSKRSEVDAKKVKLTVKNYKHPKHSNRIDFEIDIDEDELDKELERLKHPHPHPRFHPHTREIPTTDTTATIVIH